MYNTSTLTKKGQIVIPKEVRDIIGLKPSDRVTFKVQKEKIIIEPIASVDEMCGFLADKKRVTDKTDEEVIQEAVVKKFEKKLKAEQE